MKSKLISNDAEITKELNNGWKQITCHDTPKSYHNHYVNLKIFHLQVRTKGKVFYESNNSYGILIFKSHKLEVSSNHKESTKWKSKK